MLIYNRYAESIAILYRENEFQFCRLEVWLYLRRILLPQRINDFRTVRFPWGIQEPPTEGSPEQEKWSEVWRVIASLEGLKKLRVEIEPSIRYCYDWSLAEKTLLEDTRKVVRPELFELYLSWGGCGYTFSLPCKILRPTEESDHL